MNDIQQILTNSTFKPILDCIAISDIEGNFIGHIDGEVYLNKEYEHAYEVYKALVGGGIFPVVV